MSLIAVRCCVGRDSNSSSWSEGWDVDGRTVIYKFSRSTVGCSVMAPEAACADSNCKGS